MKNAVKYSPLCLFCIQRRVWGWQFYIDNLICVFFSNTDNNINVFLLCNSRYSNYEGTIFIIIWNLLFYNDDLTSFIQLLRTWFQCFDRFCWNSLLAPADLVPRCQPELIVCVRLEVVHYVELMVNVTSCVIPIHWSCVNKQQKSFTTYILNN